MTDMRKQKKPYIIPSQPQVLLEVVKLLGSNDATVDRLVAIMMKDVSLYTACIASANTPVFGGKGRVSSLKEALMRIGFNKMLTILRLLSLKNSFSKTLDLEKFWETATEVAELTVSISKKIFKSTKRNNKQTYKLTIVNYWIFYVTSDGKYWLAMNGGRQM